MKFPLQYHQFSHLKFRRPSGARLDAAPVPSLDVPYALRRLGGNVPASGIALKYSRCYGRVGSISTASMSRLSMLDLRRLRLVFCSVCATLTAGFCWP